MDIEIGNRPPLHKQQLGKGVIFGVLAAISFTLMSLFGKIIDEKASTDTVLFARFFISLCLLMPWVIRNPKAALKIEKLPTIILRSLFTLLAFGCFFYALRYISLADGLLLNNSFPLFVPLIAWATGGHPTSHKVWMGILVGFVGVALVLKPTSGFFHMASLIGLTSGILAAVSIVLIRRLTKTTPVIQILFYNFAICSLLTGILLPFGWQAIDAQTLIFLLCVGILGAAYQLFSTLSFAKTSARITSPLMFLCILFGVFIDWLIHHHFPGGLALIGMALVIVGGIITIYYGQKEMARK